MMNIRKLYFFVGLLFVIHSCSSKIESEELSNVRSLSDLPISQWTFDEILAIDEQKYEAFCKDEVFIDIAMRYKKSKDYYYYSDEVDYKNISCTLDSILVKIDKYAKEQGCVNLVTYINRYASTSLAIGSRCYFGESMEKCWKRAWDFYDNTYKKSIYKQVKNENAVIVDLAEFLEQKTARTDLVFRNMLDNNYVWGQIEYMGGLKIYFNTIGLAVIDSSEVHTVNRSLYDSFYWYYLSNRWLEVGGVKKDPNLCQNCQCNPCICYTECPQCGRYRIHCVCCKKCGVYPCQCSNYVTRSYPGGMIRNGIASEVWNIQSVKEKVNNYLLGYEGNLEGAFIYGFRLLGSGDLYKTWNGRNRENEMYTVPVEAEDVAFIHAHGYSEYPDEIDIYCFAMAVETRKEKRIEIGIPVHYNPFYMMFFITNTNVYALFSLGELGNFFNAIPNELSLRDFAYAASQVETNGEFIYNQRRYLYKYESGEDKLYQYVKVLQTLGCDIQILKLKKGRNDSLDEFVKGWYVEGIDNEEDVRK